MQKSFLMRGFKFLCSKTSPSNAANPNYKTPSLASFHFHNFYTSKSKWLPDHKNEIKNENPPSKSKWLPDHKNEIKNKNPLVDVKDVSIVDLKRQVDKLNKGDFEAIPTILESILKRTLSRKPEKFLKTFSRLNQEVLYSDTETDSDSYSDIDSDSDFISDSDK